MMTGANLANRDLMGIGVSGDGDSASIGLGQFAHIVRRRINMLYLVDNNGTYGLTKGQFSATNDKGSTSKRIPNLYEPIDLVSMALQLGASFVARSFSGDKKQLVPLIKAALKHKGMAFIDVISPCVAFNNHVGSTKSYEFTRDHLDTAVNADLILTSPKLRQTMKREQERMSQCLMVRRCDYINWMRTTIRMIGWGRLIMFRRCKRREPSLPVCCMSTQTLSNATI